MIMSLNGYANSIVRRLLVKPLFNISKQDKCGIKRWVAPTLRELQRRRDKEEPGTPQPRSSYLEWNYDAEVYAFGKRLNEKFNENVLRIALAHKSYVQEQEDKTLKDNAELIEQGESIIKSYLKERYKSYPEQVSYAIMKYLMSDSLLSFVGSHIGLTDIILTKEFPIEELTIAKTFKAVVAALETSENLSKAHTFLNDFLVSQLTGKDLFDIWQPEQPFEELKFVLEQKGVSDVEARLCNAVGKNTILAAYRIGLYHEKKLIGIGWGESVEIARNTAACNALQKIYNVNI